MQNMDNVHMLDKCSNIWLIIMLRGLPYQIVPISILCHPKVVVFSDRWPQ